MNAGRIPLRAPAADPDEPVVLEAEIAKSFAEVREVSHSVALADQQHAAHVRAVATQLGYSLPAECVDPDLIQRDIAANMRRSVEACLEVGRGLAVLKEACQHGEFMARIDVLGVDRKVAAKFMQAARKFSNVSTTRHLTAALGNQSKLFEMLVLDDECLEELETAGQTGELKLDSVATMSVKELRAAVRELMAEKAAKEELLSRRARQVDALEEKLSRSNKLPPDAVALELQAECTRSMNDSLGALRGRFAWSLRQLDAHEREHNPGNSLAFMAGVVGQVQAELDAIRDSLGIPDVLPALIPEWVTDPAFKNFAAN